MTARQLAEEDRHTRLLEMRWRLAAPSLVALAGLATNYAVRGLSPTSTGTQPVVAAFDSYPGVWPTIFTVPLVALVLALMTKRFIQQAHVLAAVAFWLYAIALAYGAVVAGAAWSTASISLGMSLTSLLLGVTYARGDR